jgi:glycosyltransferase involved in cell wall biosynthesis
MPQPTLHPANGGSAATGALPGRASARAAAEARPAAGGVGGVLFVVPAYPPPVVGGLERQAHELARALRARGEEVTVLSLRTAPDQPADGEYEGVRVVRIPPAPGPLLAVALAAKMAALRDRYRVVHLHNISWFGVPVIGAARLLGRPVLTKVPSSGHLCGLTLQVERPFGRVWLEAFKRSDAVVALGDESVEELRTIGYPLERVFRVSNGVSPERFHPSADGENGAGPVRFLYVGRLSHEKGVEDLLEAWPAVAAAAGRPVRLDIYGDGPLMPRLRARAAALGGDVVLHGAVDDVAPILRGADVLVLPSYIEGNSNALLEAMATGLAVVATRTGGTPFLVGPEGERWLVPVGDRAALADRMAEMARGDEARRAAGAALLARARAHFDVDAVAGAYREVYRLLARGERRVALASPALNGEAPPTRL